MRARKNVEYRGGPAAEAPVLREMVALPAIGESISVRAAKAHLSALLDLVAQGREVVITSDGEPKVKLVSYHQKPTRKRFTGAADHLARMPVAPAGPTAEDLIRADRDGRGW